jgi:hypothetical protein
MVFVSVRIAFLFCQLTMNVRFMLYTFFGFTRLGGSQREKCKFALVKVASR